MKITKETVAALTLPPGKADHIEWDDSLPGFGVRLRGNSKSYVVQYRVGRQQRRESFDIRKMTPEDARKIARQRFAQIELGVDPAERRQDVGLTLKPTIDRYLDGKRDLLRTNTYKAAERHFAVHWKPLHNRLLDEIKRADVAAVLQDIIKAHGRTAARASRANLSALFNWAMREGLCEANPCLATNDPTAGSKPRERVLDDAEIGAIWRACSGDIDADRIIKLLLLTGCRREEIGALEQSEINLDSGTLVIPGTRTKNGRALELPLPDAALAILRAVPRQDGRRFVFGKTGSGFSGWSVMKATLDARITVAEGKPLAPWVLHDLRRTFRTGLGRLGVAPHIAELCINHVKGGIQAVYDKHRYQGEIGAALALWADHVVSVASGKRQARNRSPIARVIAIR
jgi:integrase